MAIAAREHTSKSKGGNSSILKARRRFWHLG